MSKFANKHGATVRTGSSPIQSVGTKTATNHGGVSAFARDAKSDLFLLGVMNFVSEDTFYESGGTRDDRFVSLVHTVTAEDPDWVARFIPWLRNEANMRSASIVAAAEYVKAGGPNARAVINSACSRADEPGEVLAYWINTHGKPIPSSVKRGVSDAAARLYNEYSVAKYDSSRSAMRFADVIQLTHAKPKKHKIVLGENSEAVVGEDRNYRQEALYKYTLDTRYGAEPDTSRLPMLTLRKSVNSGEITRDQLLADPDLMKRAGMTWESLSGLGQMDAAAWEAVIPQMGYMALLRNLRNFEQAGISAKSVAYVTNFLSDPERVAKSRQFPFRFWSAYKNTGGLKYASAIETALDLSLQNLPSFNGRTLILTDTSQSMRGAMSGKGTMDRLQAAALFATALSLKGEDVDLFGWADYSYEHKISKGGSVLREMEKFVSTCGVAGYGTNLSQAMTNYKGHDRVIIFSDMQVTRYYKRSSILPANVPVYGFNLAGYATTQMGEKNDFELGGLTDHTFKLIPLIEQRKRGTYPF